MFFAIWEGRGDIGRSMLSGSSGSWKIVRRGSSAFSRVVRGRGNGGSMLHSWVKRGIGN